MTSRRRSQRLLAAVPSEEEQQAAPTVIHPTTDVRSVKVFLYKIIRGNDEELEDDAVWALARKSRGNGETVL